MLNKLLPHLNGDKISKLPSKAILCQDTDDAFVRLRLELDGRADDHVGKNDVNQ